jgi:UPF0042 nucleotide-binding protein
LLESFMDLDRHDRVRKMAIAMDVRSAKSLPGLPRRLAALRSRNVQLTTLFLDSTTDTLVRRFSETRRLHPLSLQEADDQRRALTDAIEYERELLAELREQALVLDTSLTRAAQLRSQVKELVGATRTPMTLVFESFAFKRGIPVDADYVFDVRMLPNPHYEPLLQPLTGRDELVVRFLEASPDVVAMERQIRDFLAHWLPHMVRDHRSYVTVAIGCTGGQHRSVYLVERLAAHFDAEWTARVRHRERDYWSRS